jgi:hypothetical protein
MILDVSAARVQHLPLLLREGWRSGAQPLGPAAQQLGAQQHRAGERDKDRELRRESIKSLAPKGMTLPQAEKWAANLTVTGMEQKLREMEIWVVEMNDAVAAWGAIRGDYLEGLYTAPGLCQDNRMAAREVADRLTRWQKSHTAATAFRRL